MEKFKTLSIFILIIILLLVLLLKKSPIISKKENGSTSSVIKIDGSDNKIVVKQEDDDIKNDPAIKSEQTISYYNDHYECITMGWNHGHVVYNNIITGTFEYIRDHKLSEKKKSDDIIYSKEVQKLQELN